MGSIRPTPGSGHADATHFTEPHRRLMAAVLQTAVDDCRSGSSFGSRGRSAVDTALVRKAEAYVRRTDRTWPFSFENLCEALGLNPTALRDELIAPPVAA